MRTPAPIPLLDLRSLHDPLRAEIDVAIARVLDSQQFVLGPEVLAFERDFAALCETRFAVSCASGSDAVLLALCAHDVGPGDQVICPAFTFFSTASAITRLGATPVFVDIDPHSFNLDPESCEKAAARCTRRKVLLPVHLFGQMANVETLLELCRDLSLPMIEDAAQAVGARDPHGRTAGSVGSVGCFSFYPTKNLGALGDGGCVVTDDEELAERLRVLRSHGAGRERYIHGEVGFNSRLDALQAAVLRVKLEHLDGWNRARRELAARYDSGFGAEGAVCGHSGPLEDARLPLAIPTLEPNNAVHVYHHYAIRVPAALRDPLRAHLASQQIGSAIYYPLGLHLQECFRSLGYADGDLPQTEAATRETLVIPMFPALEIAQQDRVIETVAGFLRKG